MKYKKKALNNLSYSAAILMREIDKSKAGGQFAAGTALLVFLLSKVYLQTTEALQALQASVRIPAEDAQALWDFRR